jgi:uncharacterized membrane protein
MKGPPLLARSRDCIFATMSAANFDDVIFSATLTPHRSLGRRGFLVLMGVLGGLWFATGLYFWSLGAWPVFGFFGLDFLAVWLAFKLNYRAGRAFEEVAVSRTAVVVRKVAANGRAQEFRFNPQWARLEVETLEDEGVSRIMLRTRGERVPVGRFLNPDDRATFARAFGAALAEARR